MKSRELVPVREQTVNGISGNDSSAGSSNNEERRLQPSPSPCQIPASRVESLFQMNLLKSLCTVMDNRSDSTASGLPNDRQKRALLKNACRCRSVWTLLSDPLTELGAGPI